MQEKEEDFEKLFIEAIDEAVDEGLNVLAESGKQMLFFHLEKNCSINRHDIPQKPEAFAAGLEKIFGVGASILEKIILKNLYSKLELKYEDKKNYTFEDYIKKAKEAARKSQKADLNISKVRQSVH